LEDAIITTFPGQTEKNEQIKRAKKAEKKYVSESVGNIRFAINTKRSELIEKINRGEITLKKWDVRLAQFARTKQNRTNRGRSIVAEESYAFNHAVAFRIARNRS
jgi:hypothetical protein